MPSSSIQPLSFGCDSITWNELLRTLTLEKDEIRVKVNFSPFIIIRKHSNIKELQRKNSFPLSNELSHKLNKNIKVSYKRF